MRDGRQLASSSQTTTIKGDIIVRDQTSGNRAGLSAPLADPDRLWPGGVVQYHLYLLSFIYILLGVVDYHFYRTFPADKRAIVMQAMEYITNNSCIRFQPKIDSTVDYVSFNYGADCHSDVGRIGGVQTLNLNR